MAADKYVVKMTNPNVASTNFQLVDFDTDPFAVVGLRYSTVDEITASILVYLASLATAVGTGTTFVEVLYRAAGSPGSVSVPFPAADYATIGAAAVVAGYAPPSLASYGTVWGAGGALAPLGTSISVSELTATVGRTGRGRHFLPFISSSVVSAAGDVPVGTTGFVESAALDILMGQASGTAPALIGIPWVLTGPASPTSKEIVNVKAQPIFSNLQSRRR